MLKKREKNSIIRQILLLIIYLIVFSPFRNKKNKNKKKKPKIKTKKTGKEQKKNKSGTKKQFSKKKTQKSKNKSKWKSKSKKKKTKLEKKNRLFNFHFLSKPDKKKPNKDKSLQNIKSDDLHLETVNIVDSLTEKIDKKKRKNESPTQQAAGYPNSLKVQ